MGMMKHRRMLSYGQGVRRLSQALLDDSVHCSRRTHGCFDITIQFFQKRTANCLKKRPAMMEDSESERTAEEET